MAYYKFTICFKSNFHVGSGFGFAGIIDNTTIKDGQELVYIPASTIKGRLRSVCRKIAVTLDDPEYKSDNGTGQICDGGRSIGSPVCKTELKEACIICRLFGSVFQEGKLIFHDVKLPDAEAERIRMLQQINRFAPVQTETKTGVQISRLRRTAQPQHLFILENVSHTLEFTGNIILREGFRLEPKEKELLQWGFNAMTHLGGQKGRGLGRLKIPPKLELIQQEEKE